MLSAQQLPCTGQTKVGRCEILCKTSCAHQNLEQDPVLCARDGCVAYLPMIGALGMSVVRRSCNQSAAPFPDQLTAAPLTCHTTS